MTDETKHAAIEAVKLGQLIDERNALAWKLHVCRDLLDRREAERQDLRERIVEWHRCPHCGLPVPMTGTEALVGHCPSCSTNVIESEMGEAMTTDQVAEAYHQLREAEDASVKAAKAAPRRRVSCAWCGVSFAEVDSGHAADMERLEAIAREHILTCPKNPSAAEIAGLRDDLGGIRRLYNSLTGQARQIAGLPATGHSGDILDWMRQHATSLDAAELAGPPFSAGGWARVLKQMAVIPDDFAGLPVIVSDKLLLALACTAAADNRHDLAAIVNALVAAAPAPAANPPVDPPATENRLPATEV